MEVKSEVINMENEHVLIGMLIAYGEAGLYDAADEILLMLDAELWIETEIYSMRDIENILYERGFDIYEFRNSTGI
jgi:hypothetical protein